MDFPLHIDTISMRLPIVHFTGLRVDFFLKFDVFLSRKVVLHVIIANSAGRD